VGRRWLGLTRILVGYRAAGVWLLVLLVSPQVLAQYAPSRIAFDAVGATAVVSQTLTRGSGQNGGAPSGTTTKPDTQSPDPGQGPEEPIPLDEGGQQTKRILGMVPNFQAVSANTQLPPLTVKQKFWLATEGTFDYSSFISTGIQAAVEQATRTYPEFGQGATGYGRYYWHTFADAAVENYFVGAIFPSVTHEDPRYYTLYRGGFLHRTGYAISRLWITKSDSGARRINFSEILGSGVATAVSIRYYPHQERGGASETLERWASQLLNDGVSNVFLEFWPDIHQKFFHRH
jgi:hypothetical protein